MNRNYKTLIILCIFLFLSCGQKKKFNYDTQWSYSVLNSPDLMANKVSSIRIYSGVSGDRSEEISSDVLAVATPLIVLTESNKIEEFLTRLSKRDDMPNNFLMAEHMLKLYHVLIIEDDIAELDDDGRIGYIRILIQNQDHGFVKPWSTSNSYRYTKGIEPWLNDFFHKQ